MNSPLASNQESLPDILRSIDPHDTDEVIKALNAAAREIERLTLPLTYSRACKLLADYAIALNDRQCCGDEMQPQYMAALKACTDAMGVRSAPETPTESVSLNGYQLKAALEFCAPDTDDQDQMESDVSIQWCEEGHSGAGYYCCCASYPEEGSILLDEKPPASPPKTSPKP